ncbi:phosphopyruvate hydratase [Patescibacteria group bacterium]|nr:phosphopyruvate hydratase [Patescibacteria group bacterium]
MRIDRLEAVMITDSRGKPTLETTISANALSATASVPSGKSTGIHEAVELRGPDGNVAEAIANVNGEIARAIVGKRFSLDELDAALIKLDGTPNKSRLGANAILSVSIAAQRLLAMLEDIPLWKAIEKRAGTTAGAPRLFMNVMNGGVHADFKLPFQEYLVVVDGTTREAFATAKEAFEKLGERLDGVPMGDEGGYAPAFDQLEEPFEILAELVAQFPHTSIAIDAAASEFYRDGQYHILDASYSADDLARIYSGLVEKFPFHSIEDPFDEESAGDFTRFTASVGEKILVIGDDFTVTNPDRILKAREERAINAVLIKPNQIGTVKEAIEAVRATSAAGWKSVASHRSGETNDTFIADFAYGVGAHGIKAGGLGQKERMEKYYRLLAIEREAEHK